jgi:hypothetical protein
VGEHPLSTLTMWSLNIWMAFLARLWQWLLGGMSSYVILVSSIFGFVCKRCLVVEYLVSWDNTASSHLCKCATAGKNEFALAVVLECLVLGGVGVQVVEDHDVVVSEAGDKGETAFLVRVQCVF